MAKQTTETLKKYITDDLFTDPAWITQPSAPAFRKAKYWKRIAKFTVAGPEVFEEKGPCPLEDLQYSDRQRGTFPQDGTSYTCRGFVFSLDSVSGKDITDDAELADTQLFIFTDAADEHVVYCAASSD